MLIEIHMIQNHSPSNLNRDDLGAPKTCIFGGVTRARISSQCLKRSIRNPGNKENVHNREPGLFAAAMAGHMGTKTKLFPWLVGERLKGTDIPENDHARIVLAAQRIGASKEKEDKKASRSAKADPRPKTAQLIHLGPRHAELFVQKLLALRNDHDDCYQYFLNPRVGFEELVANELVDSDLDEKMQEKIVKASWVIAKCRMSEVLNASAGGEPEDEPPLVDGQPGVAHAKLIALKLIDAHTGDEDRFKKLTKTPTDGEKKKVKDDAPAKPKKIGDFIAALKEVHRYDAVDIALFGRMTTSDAFEDVEAAMQVAHALSTHAAVNEVDYFTAVDDKGVGVGAGHVGEAMYNSACFYKYFCLDWDHLVGNLAGPEPREPKKPRKPEKLEPDATDEQTRGHAEEENQYKKDDDRYKQLLDEHSKAVAGRPEIIADMRRLAAAALGHFIRAAAMTTPSGKQNSFAANNEPCGILVEIKKNGKVSTSYANAFAEPVERIGKPDDDAADEKSIEGRSVACLADQVQSMRTAYGIDSTLLWYSPKLWRFPLQYWEREADGKKKVAKPVVTEAKSRFDVLGGEGKAGLVEAVVKEVSGLDWADVRDAGKAPA